MEITMLDSLIAMQSYFSQIYFVTGESPQSVGTQHSSIVPYGSFPTSDGHVIVTSLSERFWHNVARYLGCEDLISDPRFRTHPNAIGSFLASSATHTKKTLVATERRRVKVRRQRKAWFKHRIPTAMEQPERIVFIDETSVKTNLTRQRGWAPCGGRLTMDAPFGSWGTQTFIAGLSADAMLAPWVIKGAMDGADFAAYVENVLVPELPPGTMVILDNLATHKNAEVEKALRKAECWFLFLPP